MDPFGIEDAVRRGRGLAALAIGQSYVLHRPRGGSEPIGARTALMRMRAQFVPFQAHAETFGHPLHEGIFDSAYTRPGDYLVGSEHVWFVASQAPLQPVLCVKCPRRVTVRRPGDAGSIGLGSYGGLQRDLARLILAYWPSSVVAHGAGLSRADLPGDAALGGWSVLLPRLDEQALRTGDLITDDLGRSGVVAAAELSDLGWRLFARQAAT